jgi:hypothetical protein
MAFLDLKEFAKRATSSPLTVSKAEAKTLEGTGAPLQIDGAPMPSGRCLVKDQASRAQNGLYEVSLNEYLGGSGTQGGEGSLGVGESWKLTRTADADGPGEITKGMLVPVQEGDVNAQTSWVQLEVDPIEVGTTDQVFEPITGLPVGPAGGDLVGTYANPQVAAGGSNSFT